LGSSIVLLVLLASGLQSPPLDVAVDEGCGFQYLLQEESRNWTAVVAKSHGTQLLPVKVLAEDEVTSKGERQLTVHLDIGPAVGNAEPPLFLISGVPAEWSASDFVTWYPDDHRFVTGRPESLGILFPGEQRVSVYEKCDARSLRLYAIGKVSRRGDELCFEDYSLHVELRDRPEVGQTIYSVRRACGSNLPELLWAGDLDRDEVADLLFRFPVDPERFDAVLYLSHFAGTGSVLGKATTRRIRTCQAMD
jgi:hypothetical protein